MLTPSGKKRATRGPTAAKAKLALAQAEWSLIPFAASFILTMPELLHK